MAYYEKQMYIKFPISYGAIFNVLKETKKNKINFFLDLNSICRGFYKSETVLFEIGEYATNGEVSGQLIKELKFFLNNLFKVFRDYDPFFVIFYDDGKCVQNTSIMKSYKSGRSMNSLLVDDDRHVTDLFRKIRHYYYLKIKEQFEKEDLSSVQYIKDYETDLIPHYCIRNNIFDASEGEILNIILSVDKDLLQTCMFSNTIMCPTNFKINPEKNRYEVNFKIYDSKNAIEYIYPKFNHGFLSAKDIPMILSLSGDKSDDILGIQGIGVSKAIKLIETNNIPCTLNEFKLKINSMPDIIQKNVNTIIRNFKLISFDEQIKRLPKDFLV